jgi:hypothetical protein
VQLKFRQSLIAIAIAGLTAVTGRTAGAQVAVACDFDIADNLGRYTTGNVMHLTGRQGASTQFGEFYIINGNSPEGDVDLDGYGPACTFNNLFVLRETEQSRRNLTNVANPSLAIPQENITVINLPRRLGPGQQGQVQVVVEIPRGTPAGRYAGAIEIRDSVVLTAFTPTRDILNRDFLFIEVTVVAEQGLALVEPNSADPLDSVVVSGRAGQRANGVFRIANAGNAPLADVQLNATDLRSESAVGLVIPARNVTFSTPTLSSVLLGDTARVTVTVDIPRGILGGRYRGSIIVGAAAAPDAQANAGIATRQEVPLIVIVQSTRGILFANNPVRGALGDVAQIAFNGDPGTAWQLGIFDMMGLAVYRTSGTVFAGITSGGGTGTAGNPGAGADFAVNAAWPLINGRGEAVASGMYVVIVESVVNGRRQVTRDRLMVIR